MLFYYFDDIVIISFTTVQGEEAVDTPHTAERAQVLPVRQGGGRVLKTSCEPFHVFTLPFLFVSHLHQRAVQFAIKGLTLLLPILDHVHRTDTQLLRKKKKIDK